MTQPAKRKVLLRPGAKFSGITVVGTGKKVRTERTMYVGPCEVEMSEAQIANFSDMLQEAPQVVAAAPEESEPDDTDDDSTEDDGKSTTE